MKCSHSMLASIMQMVPDLDKVIVSRGGQSLFSPLLAHIADELSELFLPSPPSSHYIIKPQEKSGYMTCWWIKG